MIAPATASTIGKMANGIADNMLITTYLSAKAPVFVAPAMDLDMFAHPATQKNLDILRSYGNHIIEPVMFGPVIIIICCVSLSSITSLAIYFSPIGSCFSITG